MSERLSGDFDDLLARQRGVFARWQVLATELDPAVVAASVRSGKFQRLHTGVYAGFTGPPCREAELWAAVLRAGPDAVLSHQTAAELDGFAPGPSGLIHVTVPLEKRVVRAPGIALHRSSRLGLTRHPARTPPRTRVEETALDLAQLATTFDDAFGWLSRPCAKRLTKPPLLLRALISRAAECAGAPSSLWLWPTSPRA